MQNCNHENCIRVMDGWFCPDCKEHFDIRPRAEVMVTILNTEEKAEEKKEAPKPKTTKSRSNSKSAAK